MIGDIVDRRQMPTENFDEYYDGIYNLSFRLRDLVDIA